MPHLLVLFLDGVGLGPADAEANPLACADTPNLTALMGGRRLLQGAAPYQGEGATLLALDACLGVPGMPQSASGQAALLTGRNVPAEIGGHYGPKPNPAIRHLLQANNLFMEVVRRGGRAALLNAYPPRYFQAVESRRRLYSAIPLAANAAGVPLRTAQDLQSGRALSADLTGVGWAAQPDFPPAPVYDPGEAGALLAELAWQHDLTWFDYWPSDYVGHRGDMQQAVALLEEFDAVLGGLVGAWQDVQGLVVLISDHGNLEDLSRRGHTRNPVPALLIGPAPMRRAFAAGLEDLAGFAPAVLRLLYDGHPR